MPDNQDNAITPDNEDSDKVSAPDTEVLLVTAPQNKQEDKSLPVIKHAPFLWKRTQSVIMEIEQKTNTKILVYYTHPLSSIMSSDVNYFFSHIKELQSESSISLVLISSGGSGMAAWRIANMLRYYCKQLTVIVPNRCASAATLLALSADKILFGPAGYLTAIDTSLNHPLNPRPNEKEDPSDISVDQVNRIKNFINEDLKIHPGTKSLSEILFEKIHPVVLGELERGSSLSKLTARNMMKLRINPPTEDEQMRIADILNDSFPAHGYPIMLKDAQQIGLPAEPIPQDMNTLYWELVKLYSIVSKKVTTNLTPEFLHRQWMPVIIESIGRRTFFGMCYDKRLMRDNIGWVEENDKTAWLSAIPHPEKEGEAKISEIEV